MEKFFVSRPVFAMALALAVVLMGVVSILNLAIEQYPDVTPPVVEVTAWEWTTCSTCSPRAPTTAR